VTRVVVTVLAHNEESRIAACLESLLTQPGEIHVIVNGSTDRTADIARSFRGVTVHVFPQGGKSRSWNRFVLDDATDYADVHVFVDGDAEVAAGSVAALAETLLADRHANACAGLPLNGRRVAAYRAEVIAQHGLFGDLYALKGRFLARMKAAGIRLPDDLVGDDGLIGAMVKTDLGDESNWDEQRLIAAETAGWLCEPTRLSKPASWRIQYRRMISYSLRYFQNHIVSHIMRETGPAGLPRTLAASYADWLPQLKARSSPVHWWFDHQALARMHAAARDQSRP
jgi:glycosyltransferase involved in cell wall biosynthesis